MKKTNQQSLLSVRVVPARLTDEKRTWGSGRCARCGKAMCQGSSVGKSVGPVCGKQFASAGQRLLLFPEDAGGAK